MVWLKLYGLIAARFIFRPSKVSINLQSAADQLLWLLIFSRICNSANAVSSLCCWGWWQRIGYQLPWQQGSYGKRVLGAKTLYSKVPSPKDGLLWTCTPLLASSARFKFLPCVALHRKLHPPSVRKCSLCIFFGSGGGHFCGLTAASSLRRPALQIPTPLQCWQWQLQTQPTPLSRRIRSILRCVAPGSFPF